MKIKPTSNLPKTDSVPGVACSALLGVISEVMRESIHASAAIQLTPGRLRFHEVWKSLQGDKAEVLLYSLPAEAKKKLSQKIEGLPVLVIALTSKTDQEQNGAHSPQHAATSQNPHPRLSRKEYMARWEKLHQPTLKKRTSRVSDFLNSYSRYSVAMTPNETSSHTATTNAAGAGQTKGDKNAK